MKIENKILCNKKMLIIKERFKLNKVDEKNNKDLNFNKGCKKTIKPAFTLIEMIKANSI